MTNGYMYTEGVQLNDLGAFFCFLEVLLSP